MPWLLQCHHEPVYIFLLWLKILAFPLNQFYFTGKTENEKCTRWLLKPDCRYQNVFARRHFFSFLTDKNYHYGD